MLNANGQPADALGRLERIAAAVAPAVWDLDIATGVFTANARLNDVLGEPADLKLSFDHLVQATHQADRGWEHNLHLETPTPAIGSRTLRFRIVRPDGAVRWLLMKVDITHVRTESGAPAASFTGIVEDISDERQVAHALAESEERLKLAIEAGLMAVWEVDLESGAVTQSAELNLLLGFEPEAHITLGDVRRLYAPGEMERIAREGVNWEQIKARAAAGQSPGVKAVDEQAHADRMQIQTEVAIITPGGERKTLLLRAQHAPSLRGAGERVTGLFIDITERKRSEERLATVARELQHRVKNSLAVVQTLAVQSFRGQTDNEAATQAFLGRVRALAVATGKILEANADAADLRDVVEDITKPYRTPNADPFLIEGKSVALSGRTATSIGMALHELCTNAMKYGALSASAGRVTLAWTISEGQLVMRWKEEGGPAVVVPIRRGFGSRLLETVLSAESNGRVETNYEPFGLQCIMSLALE